MRNAKDDLALCDKATPGPWTEEPSGEKVGGFSCDVAIAATQGRQKIYARPRGGTFPYNDKRFIAMAREALPYWIERAAKLEQENAALKEAFTAAYKILMSDYGIYEACRTLREAMERSGEGDER